MKTTTCAGLVGLAVAACLSTNAVAGQQQQAGPTMEETKAWLETEGRDLMRTRAIHLDSIHAMLFVRDEQIETIILDNCVVSWRVTRQTTTNVGGQQDRAKTDTVDVVVALRDLSIGSITVEPDTLLTDTPVFAVRLVVRQTPDAASTSSVNSGNPVALKFATLPAGTAGDGQRIANAIKRATALCGGGVASSPF